MISDTIIPSTNNTRKSGSNSPNQLQRIFSKLPPHPNLKSYNDNPSIRSGVCPFILAQQEASLIFDEPTQEQIDLVRVSWERVSEIRLPTDDPNVSPSHAFGLAFYDALFDMNIECKHLFTNVFQQARALTGMISYIARAPKVVKNQSTTIRDINARKRENPKLEEEDVDSENLVIKMRDLGARHYFYKVLPHHFDLVGPAFVTALKKRLGDEYIDEIGEAWMKANGYAAHNMKIGYETQRAWEEDSASEKSSKKIKAGCVIQ